MLKNLLVLALAFLLIPLAGVNQSGKAQDEAKGHQPTKTASPVVPQNLGCAAIQDRRSDHVDADVRVIASPAKDGYDKASFWINLILAITAGVSVGLGIWTLLKIIAQSEEMKLQRLAMEKTLVAMEAQTAHMVATERPFLMVKALGDATSMHFIAENKGKSPAKIIFMDRLLRWELLPLTEDLPSVPSYGNTYESVIAGAESVNVEWVAPEKETIAGGFQVKSLYGHFPTELEAIKNSQKRLWLFGVIRYKGLTGDTIYESRFCYRLGNDMWHMLGPPGYNDYT